MAAAVKLEQPRAPELASVAAPSIEQERTALYLHTAAVVEWNQYLSCTSASGAEKAAQVGKTAAAVDAQVEGSIVGNGEACSGPVDELPPASGIDTALVPSRRPAILQSPASQLQERCCACD